jgi:carboxylesterase type B
MDEWMIVLLLALINNTGDVLGMSSSMLKNHQFHQQQHHAGNTDSPFMPQLYPLMPWGAAIDKSMDGLMDLPYRIYQQGKHNKVNVIIGTNKDEGSIFIPAFPLLFSNVTLPISDQNFNFVLLHFFSHNQTAVDLILQQYPTYQFTDNDSRAAAILRDHFFACSTRRVARALISGGTKNVWVYHFTYKGDWVEVTL